MGSGGKTAGPLKGEGGGTIGNGMTDRIRRMLIRPIEGVDDAESILADAALGFYAYGTLQLIVGGFLLLQSGSIGILALGALILCFAHLMKLTRSRALAGVLLIYSGIELFARAFLFGYPNPAARISGLVLPVVMGGIAYGAVRATLRFQELSGRRH